MLVTMGQSADRPTTPTQTAPSLRPTLTEEADCLWLIPPPNLRYFDWPGEEEKCASRKGQETRVWGVCPIPVVLDADATRMALAAG